MVPRSPLAPPKSSQIEAPRPSASSEPSIWNADVATPHMNPSGTLSQAELQRRLAPVEEDAGRPRVREREQAALLVEDVGLVIALGRHPLPGAEVAIVAGDELAEAGEVLARRPLVPLVAGRLREADHLGQA